MQGYVITNMKGDIIKSNYNEKNNPEEANKLASFIPELVFKTKTTCQNLGEDVAQTHPEPAPVHAHQNLQVRAAHLCRYASLTRQ